MGIAKMLTLSDLLLPLHTLASRWMPARHTGANAMRYVAVRPSRTTGTPHTSNVKPQAVKALRVVRLVDAQSPYAAGRLVISGRLDQVCAELSRLAALESPDSRPVTKHLH